MSTKTAPPPVADTGLRQRKKARRRDEIIVAAKTLFARQGIDATTMADIAEAAGISAPTVFNYFGSKDGVLIAMITEGTSDARKNDRDLHWQDGLDLTGLLARLFLRVSTRTLEIADRQVWRYAEAAAIRQPQAELSHQYAAVTEELVKLVAAFLDGLSLTTRAGAECPTEFLARLFHDVWFPLFLILITDEEHSLPDHAADLTKRFEPLVALLFTDDCARHPQRKAARHE